MVEVNITMRMSHNQKEKQKLLNTDYADDTNSRGFFIFLLYPR